MSINFPHVDPEDPNVVVLSDSLEVSYNLDGTFEVIPLADVPSEEGPGLNETYDVEPGLNDTYDVGPGLNDTYDVGPGLNETYEVGIPQNFPCPDPDHNDTYVISDRVELSPDLMNVIQCGPIAQSSPNSPQYGYLDHPEPVPLATSSPPSPQPGPAYGAGPAPYGSPGSPDSPGSPIYPEGAPVVAAAPGLNATFQVTPGGAAPGLDATFEVPTISEIPPGWHTPMRPINRNIPPRALFVDVMQEDMLRRRQERFQRAARRLARRRERREQAGRPRVTPEPPTWCKYRGEPGGSSDRRGGGGGGLRM